MFTKAATTAFVLPKVSVVSSKVSPNFKINHKLVNDVSVGKKEKNFYKENGYLVIDKLIPKKGLDEWRHRVLGVISEKGKVEETNADSDPFNNISNARNLWQTNDQMKDLLFSTSGIWGKIARQLEDLDSIRLWSDQLLVKDSYGTPSSWKMPAGFWGFDSKKGVSVWIALDDITFENGCMYVLKKSHKIVEKKFDEQQGKLPDIKAPKNMTDFFQSHPDVSSLKSKAITLSAGDCVFHNGMLVNATGANMTNRRWRAMNYHLMPGDSVFNGKQSTLTSQQFDALKVGDVLKDDNIHPILSKRKEKGKEKEKVEKKTNEKEKEKEKEKPKEKKNEPRIVERAKPVELRV